MSVSPRGNKFEVYVKRGTQRLRVAAKTKAQGEAMEREIIACLEAGRTVDLEAIKAISETGKKTLGQAVEMVKARAWKGMAYERRAGANADEVVAILGAAKPLDEISVEDIDSLIVALEAKGSSGATINRKLAALSKVFSEAKKRRWITTSPVLDRKPEGGGRIRFLSDEEERALLNTTAGLGWHDEADLWVFLMDTGARVETEALSLQWQDVTPSNSHVTFWDTKNGKPRTVPCTERVKALLASRRHLKRPFTMPYRRAWYAWTCIRERMGMAGDPQWVIHMLRHTCASRLVQRGVHLLVVREWMGHSDIQQTMLYSHLAPSNLDAALSALEPATPSPKLRIVG